MKRFVLMTFSVMNTWAVGQTQTVQCWLPSRCYDQMLMIELGMKFKLFQILNSEDHDN